MDQLLRGVGHLLSAPVLMQGIVGSREMLLLLRWVIREVSHSGISFLLLEISAQDRKSFRTLTRGLSYRFSREWIQRRDIPQWGRAKSGAQGFTASPLSRSCQHRREGSKEAACASCGFENLEGKKFCEQCDAKLLRVCPCCGTEVRPT